MLTQDYEYIHSYYQGLIQRSSQVHMAGDACVIYPTLKDRLCLQTGNLLISIGKKIKEMSTIREKGAYTGLSRECS
jgi:hypothetical protein